MCWAQVIQGLFFLFLSLSVSFSALTLLVGSFDPLKSVPDMTYNVLVGR